MQTGIRKETPIGIEWMKNLGASHAAPGIALLVSLILASIHKQMTLYRPKRNKDK